MPSAFCTRIAIPRFLAALLLALLGQSALAQANTQVLLVGVSEYPGLEKQLHLSGPANDVSSYYQMFVGRGIPTKQIHVLADNTRIPDARLPTKKAILDAFEQIEQSLRASPSPDNFVFVLMAGHGSQMPAAIADTSETDGLDEIFLPRDVGKWDGEIGRLPNALADNEIGAMIDRLRQAGAFVWAVFDNCHSGGITRGSSIKGEKNRTVPPASLGIPEKVLAASSQRALAIQTRGATSAESMVDLSSAAGKGDFVAFYASQSYETTPEILLPQFASDATPRGLFSYTLQQVLNEGSKASYRQVAEQVMHRYRALGRNNPTPSVEGTALDVQIFGSQITSALRQWPVEIKGTELILRAGQLHELTQGSILAVVPEATSADTKTLGHVEVIEAGSTQSLVRPIAYGSKPPLDSRTLANGGAYARPVGLKVDFTLRVAEPIASALCDAPSPALAVVIQQIKTRTDIARRVQWVSADQPADIRLCPKRNQLLFLDATAEKVATPASAISLDKQSTVTKAGSLSPAALALGGALERIGRAMNLVRIVASGSAADPLLEFKLIHQSRCPARAPHCAPVQKAIAPLTATDLRDGDKVIVTVTNTSNSAVDFSALYLDANYGISMLYPDEAQSSRIARHDTATFDVFINAKSVGREKLLFVAVAADPQSPEVRFDSLAQSGLSVAQTRNTRRGPVNPLVQLLEDAAFGEASGTIQRSSHSAQLAAPQLSFFEWTVTK